eukprot:m.163716 g.163716  ORF g.163716 m.163716 type:complete len:324 (+) comp12328_c0_seq1:181-1152(+)
MALRGCINTTPRPASRLGLFVLVHDNDQHNTNTHADKVANGHDAWASCHRTGFDPRHGITKPTQNCPRYVEGMNRAVAHRPWMVDGRENDGQVEKPNRHTHQHGIDLKPFQASRQRQHGAHGCSEIKLIKQRHSHGTKTHKDASDHNVDKRIDKDPRCRLPAQLKRLKQRNVFMALVLVHWLDRHGHITIIVRSVDVLVRVRRASDCAIRLAGRCDLNCRGAAVVGRSHTLGLFVNFLPRQRSDAKLHGNLNPRVGNDLAGVDPGFELMPLLCRQRSRNRAVVLGLDANDAPDLLVHLDKHVPGSRLHGDVHKADNDNDHHDG